MSFPFSADRIVKLGNDRITEVIEELLMRLNEQHYDQILVRENVIDFQRSPVIQIKQTMNFDMNHIKYGTIKIRDISGSVEVEISIPLIAAIPAFLLIFLGYTIMIILAAMTDVSTSSLIIPFVLVTLFSFIILRISFLVNKGNLELLCPRLFKKWNKKKI